jgi:hypothetical protein
VVNSARVAVQTYTGHHTEQRNFGITKIFIV